MNNKLISKPLGITNTFKLIYLYTKWIALPNTALKLANNIYLKIVNKEIKKNDGIYAIGYLNSLFEKYIEFGKNHSQILEINKQIDTNTKTNNKIIDTLIMLRKIRKKIKKIKLAEKDQVFSDSRSFGVSQGVSKGKVFNVLSTKQNIPKGCICIFPTSGTRYTQQLLKCSGAIFKNGATTAHLSIVARENNIPAIVCPNIKVDNEAVVKIYGSNGKYEVVDMGK